MIINVKAYRYRWFDKMLIVITEENDVLYLYCPSECKYNDVKTTFYCYTQNIIQHLDMAIKSISYTFGKTKYIQCDGVANFIKYNPNKKNNKQEVNHSDYWKYFNNDDDVKKDTESRQWSGFAEAVSNIMKK